MKQEIIVLFHGGIGNQIYEYCFYRWIQEYCKDVKVYADITEYNVLKCHQGFEITKIFPKAKIKKASNLRLFFIQGEIPRFYSGIGKSIIENKLRKPINKIFFLPKEKNIFLEKRYTSTVEIKEAVNNGKKYYSGYWQNINYFEDIKALMLEELQFVDISDKKNKKYLEMIRNVNSVSIHVRRGDYIQAGIELMGKEYYNEAIDIIRKKVDKPVFFIFSDDKEFIEREFLELENKIIVSNNINEMSYIDMQLMSECKHNIIANSTFSLWAAILNKYEDKIVIFPEHDKWERKVDKKWIKINNK